MKNKRFPKTINEPVQLFGVTSFDFVLNHRSNLLDLLV